MIVIGNVIEQALLDYLLLTENIYLKLFTNNVDVDNSTILGDFTEMTGIGYAQKTLAVASWVKNSGTDGSYYEYPNQTWTFTPVDGAAAINIYGYYLVGVTSGELKLAEKFEGGASSILYGVKNSESITLRVGID